jgi:RimJ/RimL family protein N-acetyltransferase
MEAIRTGRLNLVGIEPDAIRHLIAGERAQAERTLGLTLPAEFPNADELGSFLPYQLQRMETAPTRRDWMARLMLLPEAVVVGHCGFHGPPEIIGRAEIGYTVFTEFRGRGYAKEAAGALVRWAFDHGEQEVYASVAPDNGPSLAVIRSVGFKQVGTQEDQIDGLELVFSIRDGQA